MFDLIIVLTILVFFGFTLIFVNWCGKQIDR